MSTLRWAGVKSSFKDGKPKNNSTEIGVKKVQTPVKPHLGVSENYGYPPNHPFLIGFSIINHPFWGTPIFGNAHLFSAISRKIVALFTRKEYGVHLLGKAKR